MRLKNLPAVRPFHSSSLLHALTCRWACLARKSNVIGRRHHGICPARLLYYQNDIPELQ